MSQEAVTEHVLLCWLVGGRRRQAGIVCCSASRQAGIVGCSAALAGPGPGSDSSGGSKGRGQWQVGVPGSAVAGASLDRRGRGPTASLGKQGRWPRASLRETTDLGKGVEGVRSGCVRGCGFSGGHGQGLTLLAPSLYPLFANTHPLILYPLPSPTPAVRWLPMRHGDGPRISVERR